MEHVVAEYFLGNNHFNTENFPGNNISLILIPRKVSTTKLCYRAFSWQETFSPETRQELQIEAGGHFVFSQQGVSIKKLYYFIISSN